MLLVTVGMWSRNLVDVSVLLTFLSLSNTEHCVPLTTHTHTHTDFQHCSQDLSGSLLIPDVFFIFRLGGLLEACGIGRRDSCGSA